MAGSVADLEAKFGDVVDNVGQNVAYLWDHWNRLRRPKIEEWKEVRNYIFATDTRTTSNDELGWKNSTTLPKLCQIRDNLHANYLSTLFPNRNWLIWEGSTDEDDAKAAMIEGFMKDLTEKCDLRKVVSQLLLDYIDYGNCFATVEYVRERFEDPDGNVTVGYEGPVPIRISPLDIVFNPTARTFEESPKILRSIKSMGELEKMSRLPRKEHWRAALDKSNHIRKQAGLYTVDDYHKALGFQLDGFSDLREYYGSNYVEVLEFYGDYQDPDTGELTENAHIVVIDRSITVKLDKNSSWVGNGNFHHGGWRKRPDNLYAMGPLDNLVGMQYRIDHLENLAADAHDLSIHPPLVIYGDVEEFEYGPGCEISIPGNDGKVEELGKNLGNITSAENKIAILEAKMEEFAGSPKNTMGVRTPGEKTAFEVQTLEAASGRIFQEKITNFEIEVLEPLLNHLLAVARQDLTGLGMTRIHDNQFDLDLFHELTPSDVNGNGSLRPRGARHFGEQAILIQNVNQTLNGPMGQFLQPHLSTSNLAKMIEKLFGIEDFQLFRKDQGIVESSDQNELATSLSMGAEERLATPIEGLDEEGI